jgi:hypothetical protein
LEERLSKVGIRRTVGRQVAYSSDLARLLCLSGERRGEEHPTCASEERATVDYWVRPQAVCGCGLSAEWGHRVGSIV